MGEHAVGKRFVVGVAMLATLGALASAWTRPVPDAARALLGGVVGAERWGGLRVEYRPPGGAPRVLDFQQISSAEAEELLATLSHGLTFHEVRESDEMERAAKKVDLKAVPGGAVRLELDSWIPQAPGGGRHYVPYLDAASRDALETVFAAASAGGWQLPEGSRLGYEQYIHYETGEPRWRSYELAATPAMTHLDIEGAVVSLDPYINRPIVILSFTEAGAARFCELTTRIAGGKLAAVVGDRVRSAPIINGAICGGRASVTMGQERDPQRAAEALAQLLSRSDVAPGGEVLAVTELEPVGEGWRDTAARLLLGVLVGLGAALATALTLRLARPRWLPPPLRAEGAFPWGRLAVTLSAPAALLLGGWLTMPGIDRELLRDRAGSLELASVAMLGVRPVLGAFVAVELAALLVPRWRWRRHDVAGRAGLSRAVATLTVVTALIQGYFISGYLEQLGVSDIGWTFRLAVIATLTTATLLLAFLAGFIRERGLGNGYGALLGGGALIELGHLVVGAGERPGWRPSAHGLMELLALVGIAALTACVLRWRVGGEGNRLALTSPAAGEAPLGSAPGVLAIFALFTSLGLGQPLRADAAIAWVNEQMARPMTPFLLCAILALAWAWLLARPTLLGPRAQQAGLGAPTWSDWWRASLVAAYFAMAVAALRFLAASTGHLLDGLTVLTLTAIALDLVGDARAYRGDVAPAAALHQAQHAAIAEQVLARAGIPCHLHARFLRALGTFFMPYAPIVVLVPTARVAEARVLLDEALRVPAGEPSTARARERTEDAAG